MNIESLYKRLVRLETKLSRGFEELGICLESDPNWLKVDEKRKRVLLSNEGRSLIVIREAMRRQGAMSVGELYELVYAGAVIGTIVYRSN
ncbi:hypothetical protein [Pseudidiomarina salilacus]|uniref:hypothetical protein n=1 Tax=Pseudidiomarina salilacus TaxID=3384452 RepID=UPI003984E6D8